MSDRFYVVVLPSASGVSKCVGPIESREIAQALAGGWQMVNAGSGSTTYAQVHEVERP